MSEFSGMILPELNALVDNTLHMSKMARVCANCRFAYQDHGNFNDGCPNGSGRKFREIGCEVPLRTNADGAEAVECGKKTVNGSRLCAEHYSEELI